MNNGESIIVTPGSVFRSGQVAQTTQLKVRRRPIDWGCSCGERDTIILPYAVGRLVWTCNRCKTRYRVRFDLKNGQLDKAV